MVLLSIKFIKFFSLLLSNILWKLTPCFFVFRCSDPEQYKPAATKTGVFNSSNFCFDALLREAVVLQVRMLSLFQKHSILIVFDQNLGEYVQIKLDNYLK